jgi:hypothetical protein
MFAVVADAVVNDPYVVDDRANLFTPEKKLVSERSVDEAVESVAVIVTGDEPMIVNCEHDADPEHDAVVVAIVERRPVLPTYVRPCDRDDSLSAEPNVDEAVENKPPPKPMAVDVEL